MPPKGSNKKQQQGGAAKSKKQREDEEFEALLKQGTKENKSKFEEKAKEQKKKDSQVPKQDRATKHKEFFAAKDKAAEAEMQRALEYQQQQQKIQQLLQQMQMGGGAGGMGGFGGFGSPFLKEPKTDITSESKENKLFDVATVEMQGWRKEMEDAHFNSLDFSEKDQAGLFGVFDGHSGKKVAQIAKVGLPALAKKYYKSDDLKNPVFFSKIYEDLDVSLKGKDEASGATAVCALISKDYISGISVGDSRAVIGRAGKAIPLSFDHKPENDEERARIEAAGGHVANNRTNGELAMSRAIGDFRYKEVAGKAADEQLVIAVPEIHTVERTPEDQFVVVACDGIFDVLSNEEVIEFVTENRPSCKNLTELGEKLLNRCLAPARGPGEPPAQPMGTDNMTCTIIELKK